ncbi:unnamed protein product [Candida verbasci]|uniref:Uncharacterized protein n=1 Tax=Candida verbasci TaxID=1227364 RepID=A0A9W4XE39_9ASCO|nr:unnamed protein product [Candida verbasci]
MKTLHLLASIVIIIGASEAAPVKRGFWDDLFGLDQTTTQAVAAATTTPQAVTIPTQQAVAPAQPATTSSSGGFWANLFDFDTPSTAAATTPITTQAPVAQAQPTAATTTSRGFLAGLLDNLFGNNDSTTSPTTAPAAISIPASVPTTSQQPAPIASSPTTAQVPAATTTSGGRTAQELWDFFFGSSSSNAAVLSPATTQPIQSSSNNVNSLINTSQSHVSSIASSNPNTLGSTYQGGSPGKNTESINTATATAINGGSTDGAEVAEGALGITYSPYTKSDGCKTASEVASDIAKLSSYEVIRLYGTDCSGIENVLSSMHSGQKLFLGVWNAATPTNELSDIVKAINNSNQGWDVVHTIAIGNERVNAGVYTAAQMKTYVDQSRQYLKQNAPQYTGPIVTVDTLVAYLANPSLCEMSDYLAVNSHPYWDGGVQPSNSGPWLQQQISSLQNVCGSQKEVLITETGWPTQGQAYGQCVPSVPNQVSAVASINKSIGAKTIMFTMYNDYWKDPGAYGVEQHWGLYGDPSE